MAIDNLLKHGVNNVFILADVALSRQPFVSYHYQVGRLGQILLRHMLLRWKIDQNVWLACLSSKLHESVSWGQVYSSLSVCDYL